MEFYQLRTFLTVAEEAHLTRAAEKLFTSQPAVSGQIRALEEELGMKLFERSSKGMLLTPAGRKLREQAQRIVEAARDFKQQADSLRQTVGGELVLGLNNRPEILRLMEVLGKLTSQHPDLRYEMVCGSSGVVLQGLDEGTISVGFFEGECSSSRLTFHKLDSIELCLAAPAAWADELSEPDWKKLEVKPWIFTSPMCSYFRAINHICQEQGLNVQPRFRVNEDITVLNLVAAGLGLTLIARSQIEANNFEGKVVALPHFRATVPLCLGYQTARAQEPTVVAVKDAVLDVWNTPRPLVPAKVPKAQRPERTPLRGRTMPASRRRH